MGRRFHLSRALGALASVFAVLQAGSASAQTSFPDRPIKIVSPFNAGSVSDVCLRILADVLGTKSGIQGIVQNQSGAGGITAAMTVKTATPDGYTVALFSNATAITVALFKKLPFDPLADFMPISGVSDFSYVMAVNGASEIKSADDLFAAARAKPGALNMGTSAVGTTPHLIAELLKSSLKLQWTIVPFRGPGDQIMAVTRGDVDVIVDTFAPMLELIANGKVRPVAVTTAQRALAAPGTPTLQELGVSGFDVSSWNGLYAPKGTPQDRIERLRAAIDAALGDAGLRAKFLALGAGPTSLAPQALDARMRGDIDRWSKVIADAGIEKR